MTRHLQLLIAATVGLLVSACTQPPTPEELGIEALDGDGGGALPEGHFEFPRKPNQMILGTLRMTNGTLVMDAQLGVSVP